MNKEQVEILLDRTRTHCGRPTRAGTPCRALLRAMTFACNSHSTTEERRLAEAFTAGYYAHAREDLRRRREAPSPPPIATQTPSRRMRDSGGCQIVQVTGGYAYTWSGPGDLNVGDVVLIPANWVTELKYGMGPQTAVVVALGTSYSGPLSAILSLVSRTVAA